MQSATLVNREVLTALQGARERTVRFHYSRTDGNCLHFVIVDIGPDGDEDWSEQESGELRWHPFRPAPEDRRLIQAWIEAGHQPSGWPLLTVPSGRGRR
jgi:hypothetical protein